ncbi:ABC transporter permease [Xanthocytophaga agilis]|uniref:ABC transporter permease n=1 Tax=Xanthocytophaga agilis TaxID=3048010 RepID=A0AAE3UHN7_9BACT|nr:ABC transporter permease [Xanthocytophaga agilis]MDJ1502833.1 ABC transporter permease [Xanthocytophaga agilis]
MIRNYVTIAFRNLWKNKAFFLITVFGLSIGLTCCLIISLYVQHELSYDKFHQNRDRIVRVVMEYKMGTTVTKVGVTGTKVAPAFKRTFPEVESGVRLMKYASVLKYEDKLFEEQQFLFADSTFFDVFSFPLLQGNPKTALAGPDKIVLTEASAKKYFGNTDPIGKILSSGKKDYMVTGIVGNVPSNSQIQFEFVASFASLSAATKPETWFNANYTTYLLLKDAHAIQTLQSKITPYMKTQAAETGATDGNYLTYELEPLTRVHLHSEVGGLEPNNSITYIYIFGAIVCLILGIACVNYVNLTTARSLERAREVGMRKVLGAVRHQLFWQFIGESGIITSVSILLSVGLTALLLPYFAVLSGQSISLNVLAQPTTLVGLALAGVVISFLAGSYPALLLSKFQPIKVLKGDYKTSGSGLWLRKSLIVFQFAISIFLIIATFTIQGQLSFIQNRKLGYNKDHILVLPSDGKIQKSISTIKTEFKRNPNIQSVTLAYETPTFIEGGYSMRRPEVPESQSMYVTAIPVDEDFVKTLGLQIIAGSNFSETDMNDVSGEDYEKYRYHYIVNESAVKALGWKVEEAVGKRMVLNKEGEIKAVVKDFHFASMHQKIEPLVIFPQKESYGVMMVKLSGQQLPETIEFLKEKWQSLAPHYPFEYHFLDDEFNQMYSSEQRTGKIFTLFASLAIVLACLGLFGLAAYTAMQRTKEIGIRKVLGASIADVVMLLSKDFVKLVFIAFLIATPIVWYAMDKWLQDFTYRINLSWWIFATAGILTMIIALLTVSFQAIKTAIINPIKSLRSE